MTRDETVLQQLAQQIVDVKDKVRRKEDLEGSLARAQRNLSRQRQRLWELETRLTEESADVEALETLSLRGLFLTLLSSKEEQLERERQEVLVARLRYDECKEAVSALEEEVADLEHQVGGLSDVEARYKSLLKQKEKLLLKSAHKDAERLIELSEAQADAHSDLREVREAISAGRSALISLDSAVSALKGAGNWGTVDLLGGGLLTTAVKHGRLDEARHWIHQAQQQLRRFRGELTDLDTDVSVDVDIGTFETFADYFFDGLIVDWVVQARIRRSLDRTVEMRRRVKTTVNALQRALGEVHRRAERIDKERQELIETA